MNWTTARCVAACILSADSAKSNAAIAVRSGRPLAKTVLANTVLANTVLANTELPTTALSATVMGTAVLAPRLAPRVQGMTVLGTTVLAPTVPVTRPLPSAMCHLAWQRRSSKHSPESSAAASNTRPMRCRELPAH
ncbi:MAG TPA: hypothetical protein VEV61_06335 [Streptosporangiaceae bacterium]|nr:hypothetical protein [Streptosporangiaceae bacterium]